MAFLPFSRLRTVAANAVMPVYLHTQPLITKNFVQVVAALRIDAPMMGAAGATFDVTPQISNDLVNWDDVTPVFTQVTPASTFPITETRQITEIAWFMRFKLALFEPLLGNVGVCFSILGNGKVDSERRETSAEFLASLHAPRVGGSGLVQFPMSPFRPPVSAGTLASAVPGPAIAPGGLASQALAAGSPAVPTAAQAAGMAAQAYVNPAVRAALASTAISKS
jgi:hypothetical protein